MPQNETNQDILTDRYVVALLYFAMGGSYWIHNMTFLGNTSVCEWPPMANATAEAEETSFVDGIRCDGNGRVNHIRLGESGIEL